MRKQGWFWHIHHQELLEWSDDIQERIEYIKQYKPEKEVPTRLKLLRPATRIPRVISEMWEKAERLGKRVYNLPSFPEVNDPDYDQKMARRRRAYDRWYAARDALSALLRLHKKQIEALHKKQCPRCPWNGQTIFPRRRR